MPREIYNEGRVVGYSAYEIYVKHALSENPDLDPVSERAWLASQLGNGTSMLLKISSEADVEANRIPHIIEVPLPQNSTLCAANTIVCSVFFGSAEVDENGWGRKITDYGALLSNTDESYPETTENAIEYPHKALEKFSDIDKRRMLQYTKLQDGLVVQPGVWNKAETAPPENDLIIPNLTKTSVVRLLAVSRITQDFYILLTGFTDRAILYGISNLDGGSTKEFNSQNGDFLGPEVFPWANKITFTYPAAAAYYLRSGLTSGNNYLKIETDEDSIETTFTPSTITAGLGISVVQPPEPGETVHVSSVVQSSNEYLGVNQVASDTENATTTNLDPATISGGLGITVVAPTAANRTSTISSPITVDSNKMIDATQTSGGSGTTKLKVSKLTSAANSGINIVQPTSNGGDVKVESKVSSSNTDYLTVSQANYTTALNLNSNKLMRDTLGKIVAGPGISVSGTDIRMISLSSLGNNQIRLHRNNVAEPNFDLDSTGKYTYPGNYELRMWGNGRELAPDSWPEWTTAADEIKDGYFYCNDISNSKFSSFQDAAEGWYGYGATLRQIYDDHSTTSRYNLAKAQGNNGLNVHIIPSVALLPSRTNANDVRSCIVAATVIVSTSKYRHLHYAGSMAGQGGSGNFYRHFNFNHSLRYSEDNEVSGNVRASTYGKKGIIFRLWFKNYTVPSPWPSGTPQAVKDYYTKYVNNYPWVKLLANLNNQNLYNLYSESYDGVWNLGYGNTLRRGNSSATVKRLSSTYKGFRKSFEPKVSIQWADDIGKAGVVCVAGGFSDGYNSQVDTGLTLENDEKISSTAWLNFGYAISFVKKDMRYWN